jgi:hypothetical protein
MDVIDAVPFCLEALKKFKEIGSLKTRGVLFEITMLGKNGFDTKSPDKKYTLKSLPGKYSGLELVSFKYVGFKQLSPEFETEVDLSKEYAAALEMFQKGE